MESCIWLGVCYGKRVSDVSDEVSVRDPCTSWGQPFFDVRLSRVSDDLLWVLYRGTVNVTVRRDPCFLAFTMTAPCRVDFQKRKSPAHLGPELKDQPW